MELHTFAHTFTGLAAAVPTAFREHTPLTPSLLPDISKYIPRSDVANKSSVDLGHGKWNNPPVADDTVWRDFIRRGCTMLAMMRATDTEAGAILTRPLPSAASRWRCGQEFLATRNMQKWSCMAFEDPKGCDMTEYQYGLADALRGIGASMQKQD
ncbi:hypothetical protein CC78DRAFT_347586 [Lojkania enalia]|uniref:Uncharacterized protein n=1 Tax=Lojkania enalia TaxID=147567 RepID=A0A9P4N0N7_9PLEO|nr:hypothetical protein CC78DRAFT_347586 [Didymosphaeria enalia]